MATRAKGGGQKTQGHPKVDGRRTNRGVQGNGGGKPGRSGRKEWTPRRTMALADPTSLRGALELQSEEAAWLDARALVQHMAAVGVPIEIMGRFLSPQINSEATLRKHFAWEIENGQWQANLQVAGVAFKMATSGHHESSTWRWLERRLPSFHPKHNEIVQQPITFRMIKGDETADGG